MNSSDDTGAGIEEKANNQVVEWLNKAMEWLGFTSGVGIIAVGGAWFIYSMINYVFVTPANVMQQMISENYFNQAQMGVVIVALGVLIKVVKEKT